MSTKYDNMTLQEMQAELQKRTGQATKLRQAIRQRELDNLALARQRDLDLEPVEGLITFERNLGGKVYRYAAIKSGARWFTTGSTCRRDGYSWSELLNEFIRDRGGDRFDVLSRVGGIDASRSAL
jgi:hypothetical protein